MSLGETPWVDKNLKQAWPRLAREVPESWLPRWRMMPKSPTSRHEKLAIEEFACGHYGCVMPTNEQGLVCKITSDPTEARFVAAYLELPKPVDGGIVKYEKVLGLADQQHKRRPLYVLWREEAYDIGFMTKFFGWRSSVEGYDDYQVRDFKEGAKLLEKFLELAHAARTDMIKLYKNKVVMFSEEYGHRQEVFGRLLEAIWQAFESANPESDIRYHKGVSRVGVLLRQCYGLAMEIANTDQVYRIGSVLTEYMDEGILLADVHLDNIGKDSDGNATITDPGHAVGIHPRWAKWPEIRTI